MPKPLKDVIKDPEFQALPSAERKKVLDHFFKSDPDFSSLSNKDQGIVRDHYYARFATPTAPVVKAHSVSPATAVADTMAAATAAANPGVKPPVTRTHAQNAEVLRHNIAASKQAQGIDPSVNLHQPHEGQTGAEGVPVAQAHHQSEVANQVAAAKEIAQAHVARQQAVQQAEQQRQKALEYQRTHGVFPTTHTPGFDKAPATFNQDPIFQASDAFIKGKEAEKGSFWNQVQPGFDDVLRNTQGWTGSVQRGAAMVAEPQNIAIMGAMMLAGPEIAPLMGHVFTAQMAAGFVQSAMDKEKLKSDPRGYYGDLIFQAGMMSIPHVAPKLWAKIKEEAYNSGYRAEMKEYADRMERLSAEKYGKAPLQPKKVATEITRRRAEVKKGATKEGVSKGNREPEHTGDEAVGPQPAAKRSSSTKAAAGVQETKAEEVAPKPPVKAATKPVRDAKPSRPEKVHLPGSDDVAATPEEKTVFKATHTMNRGNAAVDVMVVGESKAGRKRVQIGENGPIVWQTGDLRPKETKPNVATTGQGMTERKAAVDQVATEKKSREKIPAEEITDPELKALHSHPVRKKGFAASSNAAVLNYLERLRAYTEKHSPGNTYKVDEAIEIIHEDGELGWATQVSEGVLNILHEEESHGINAFALGTYERDLPIELDVMHMPDELAKEAKLNVTTTAKPIRGDSKAGTGKGTEAPKPTTTQAVNPEAKIDKFGHLTLAQKEALLRTQLAHGGKAQDGLEESIATDKSASLTGETKQKPDFINHDKAIRGAINKLKEQGHLDEDIEALEGGWSYYTEKGILAQEKVRRGRELIDEINKTSKKPIQAKPEAKPAGTQPVRNFEQEKQLAITHVKVGANKFGSLWRNKSDANKATFVRTDDRPYTGSMETMRKHFDAGTQPGTRGPKTSPESSTKAPSSPAQSAKPSARPILPSVDIGGSGKPPRGSHGGFLNIFGKGAPGSPQQHASSVVKGIQDYVGDRYIKTSSILKSAGMYLHTGSNARAVAREEADIAHAHITEGLSDAEKQDLGRFLLSNRNELDDNHAQKLNDREMDRIWNNPKIQASLLKWHGVQERVFGMRQKQTPSISKSVGHEYTTTGKQQVYGFGSADNPRRTGEDLFASMVALKDSQGNPLNERPSGSTAPKNPRTQSQIKRTRFATPATGLAEEYSTDVREMLRHSFNDAVLGETQADFFQHLKDNGLGFVPTKANPIAPKTITYSGVEYPLTPRTYRVGKVGVGQVDKRMYIPQQIAEDYDDMTSHKGSGTYLVQDPKTGEVTEQTIGAGDAHRFVMGIQLASPRIVTGHALRVLSLATAIADPMAHPLRRAVNSILSAPTLRVLPRLTKLYDLTNLDFDRPNVKQARLDLARAGALDSSPFEEFMGSGIPGLSKVKEVGHGALFAEAEGKGSLLKPSGYGLDTRVKVLNEMIRRSVDGYEVDNLKAAYEAAQVHADAAVKASKVRGGTRASKAALKANANAAVADVAKAKAAWISEQAVEFEKMRKHAFAFGEYVKKPSRLIEFMKRLNPYAGTSAPLRATEISQLLGKTGELNVKTSGRNLTPAQRAAWRAETLSNGILGTIAGYILLNALASGHYPWENKEANTLELGNGWIIKALGLENMHLSMSDIDPAASRALSTLGLLRSANDLETGDYMDIPKSTGRGLINAAVDLGVGPGIRLGATAAGLGLNLVDAHGNAVPIKSYPGAQFPLPSSLYDDEDSGKDNYVKRGRSVLGELNPMVDTVLDLAGNTSDSLGALRSPRQSTEVDPWSRLWMQVKASELLFNQALVQPDKQSKSSGALDLESKKQLREYEKMIKEPTYK